MNLEARATIQQELDKGSSFKSIGSLLEKDCTTISKEVRKHIFHEKTGTMEKGFNDCIHSVSHSCKNRNVCDRLCSV